MDRKTYRTLLIASSALLAIHMLYLGIGILILEGGSDDFLFRLTSIRRRTQLEFTASIFLIISTFGICNFVPTYFGKPNFSDKLLCTLVLFGLVFLTFMAFSSSALLVHFNHEFWFHLFAHMAFVLLLFTATLYVVIVKIRSPVTTLFFLAGLSTLNAFSLFSLLLDVFLQQTILVQIAVACVIASLMTALFCVAGQTRERMWRINIVFAVMAIIPFVIVISEKARHIENIEAVGFDNVRLNDQPDVHILSFDGLVPPVIAREYLAIDELPYAGIWSIDGAFRFHNAFSSYVATEPFVNSVMRLAQSDLRPTLGYFYGQTDSPVAKIFRENGYKVTTGKAYGSAAMAGPFLSETSLPTDATILDSLFCRVSGKSAFSLFLLCPVADIFFDGTSTGRFIDEFAAKLAAIKRKDPPQFTFHHVLTPRHVDSNFRSYDEQMTTAYAKRYFERSITANTYMERLVSIIKSKQRDSIVLLTGDHGAFLSQTVHFHENPEFFVKDQYGISLAMLFNSSSCPSDQFYYYEGNGYITLERVLAAVIRCLADDKNALDEALNFEEEQDLAKYLYE